MNNTTQEKKEENVKRKNGGAKLNRKKWKCNITQEIKRKWKPGQQENKNEETLAYAEEILEGMKK